MQGAPPKQSLLMFVIQSGGGYCLWIVLLGGFLTLWGLINLAFVKNRGSLIAQALLSFAPLGLAFLGLCYSLQRFVIQVNAAGVPQPEDVATNTALAILSGLTGATAAGVPGVIGVLALARNLRRPARACAGPISPTDGHPERARR
jgi:hypothetical protein